MYDKHPEGVAQVFFLTPEQADQVKKLKKKNVRETALLIQFEILKKSKNVRETTSVLKFEILKKSV